MSREIEAKFRLDNLECAETALKKLNAEFVENQFQRDYFFYQNQPSGKPAIYLRLRQQQTDGNQRAFLTYKGSKQDSKFKKRVELELEIDDVETARSLLTAIGYQQGLSYEKKRQYWKYKHCQVLLDEVPMLGFFVEIEAEDENLISEVQTDMGLSDYEHINNGYASMISEKLSASGAKEKQVYFNGQQL